MEIAGVDGCERGWAIVRALAPEPLHLLDIDVQPTFADVLKRTAACAAIAVDIPIGLSDDGRREPDIVAREILRPLRHSSVFPAPVRAVLAARDYREACALSASARSDGKKISKQTYYLSLRIAEVDRLMSSDPSLQDRVVEAHPEVCFWALNGHRPLRHYKRTPEGALERLELLSRVFVDNLAAVPLPPGTARDDVLDACAAAWTAARVAHGTAQRLPAEPRLDARGLRMEIVY